MKNIKRIGKYFLTIILSLAGIVLISACVYLQHPTFGKAPSGARLERIKRSPNYSDGKFHNIHETPTFADGYTFWGEVKKSLFREYPHREPEQALPSAKTDLINLPIDSAVVIWFGHSSCYIQMDRRRILVDPVFSKNASPFPGSVKAFEGTTLYSADDMPPIDYLLITHDHYDHLDYRTVKALKEKTTRVICGLGVGSHLEHWGYHPEQIREKDWYEKEMIDSAFFIAAEPARHKSGRGLRQNNTLWLSFLIKATDATIYISGDGGYDEHFKETGQKFGPVDLAIMENGQYDSAWHHVHLLPEEVLLAARDLRAQKLLPVHHSKFSLARHSWHEPLDKITTAVSADSLPTIITPLIGQPVYLGSTAQSFTQWWKDVP